MENAAVSAQDYFYTGTHLLGEGEMIAAETAFKHALSLAPQMAEAHANLGWLLEQRKQLQEAETHYRRALALNPAQVQTLINFGAFLTAQKRFDEAEAVYLHARRITPESAPASTAVLSNLGMLLACMQREAEAEILYRTAIALDPAYRKARFNLAYLMLRQGRYEEGWACMDAREWNTAFEEHLPFPRWQGEPLAKKSLLIAVEGGFGDMIQFCRYARLAKEHGATHVALLCHPELKRLLRSMTDIDDIIGYDEALPAMAWDYWTMPLSLPWLFNTTLDTVPARLPYLFAEATDVRRWKQLIDDTEQDSEHASCGAPTQPLRVGLAWQGNPQFENDLDRSLPTLDLLAPLGNIEGTRYFSLQKGEPARSTSTSLSLCDLTARIEDFADTAAFVTNLDLVITIDSAVAHLAAAVGTRCWVLLPAYQPDWRWLAERADTPWYPELMRLFRQQHAGDWAPVVRQVVDALQALAQQQNKDNDNK